MHMQLNTVFSTFQVKLYYLKKFLGFSDVLLLETGVSCFAKKNHLTVYVIYFGLPVIGQ